MDIDALHAKIYAQRLAAGLVVRTTREEGRTWVEAFASYADLNDYKVRAKAAGFTVEIVE